MCVITGKKCSSQGLCAFDTGSGIGQKNVMPETTTAYISLGGNTGGQKNIFPRALERLGAFPGIAVTAVSSQYATQPQGDKNQPWFSNQVAAIRCAPNLSPGLLLEWMLLLETDLGRVRDASRRSGPRSIDLDLLLYGDIVSHEQDIIVPHPRMTERAFVLIPLLEIAPECRLPCGASAASFLQRLTYRVEGLTIFQP